MSGVTRHHVRHATIRMVSASHANLDTTNKTACATSALMAVSSANQKTTATLVTLINTRSPGLQTAIATVIAV